jgi:hypothetical protein
VLRRSGDGSSGSWAAGIMWGAGADLAGKVPATSDAAACALVNEMLQPESQPRAVRPTLRQVYVQHNTQYVAKAWEDHC